MMRFPSLARCLPGLALLLLLATGCRTYGGYGTEEALPRQMQQAVEQFADDLDRARSDVEMLAEAADQNSALAPVVEQYEHVIGRHEAFLDVHRQLVDRFQDDGAYRALHRNYGAMISEQRLVETWYQELHRRVQRVQHGQPAVGEVPPASRYAVNPSYYDRIQNRQPLTMEAALQSG